MNGDLIQALKMIEQERNIPFTILKEAVESALTSSYRKKFGDAKKNTRVIIDIEGGGGLKVLALKTIVKRRKDPTQEITLTEALKKFKDGDIVAVYPPYPEITEEEWTEETKTRIAEASKPIKRPKEADITIGNRVEVVIDENLQGKKGFGRIAAQTTKQVIRQKIREAERDILFEEYSKKIGEVISVTVQKQEYKNWICDLGKAEGIIPPHEQVPGEHFRRGERVKVYVLDVEKTPRGPQVILSRTHPGLIRKLFEMEVPEISQGLVEIHNIAREPGARSKVSVRALEPNIDPLGACVGPRGSRVQMVVDELKGEKIDIIQYTKDPFTFVSNALSPARVLTVTLNPEDRSALVIVPDDQFSLAIGKEGQNARLAAKLTNWKIDIKSESQAKELEEQMKLEEERRRQEEERRRKEEEERRRREEEERRRREEEERRRREEEERRRQEEERRRKEEEERKRREEEERRRREEEERRRREEEERRRQEEERRRKEQEELEKIKDYVPQFDDEEFEPLAAPIPVYDEEKKKEIDEALKHIPKDIPVDQYVAMAFGDDDFFPDIYFGRVEGEEPKKKKKKKKKKKRRGWELER